MLAVRKLRLLATARPFREAKLRAPVKRKVSLPFAVMCVWLKLCGRLK